MRAIDDAALLEAWDTCAATPRPSRELGLLAALEGTSADELATLPVGTVDRRMLALHQRLVGSTFEGEAACPHCGAELSVALDLAALPSRATLPGASGLTFAAGDLAMRVVPPTFRDLIEASRAPDAAAVLAARCVDARRDGDPVPVGDLPDEVLAQAEERIARVDPLCDLVLSITCAECDGTSNCTIDPGAMVLAAVDHRARALINEVDVLARAYGWSEGEVLALPEARRAQYVERASL